MKPLHDVPANLIERDSDRMVPPGGGLVIVMTVSFAFWGSLVWLVL